MEIGVKYIWRRRDIRRGKTIPYGWLRSGKENDRHNIGFILITPYETETAYKNIYNKKYILCNSNNHYIIKNTEIEILEEGTYELCGPYMQKNIHNFNVNLLVPHDIYKIECVPGPVFDEYNLVSLDIFKSLCEIEKDVDLDKIRNWFLKNDFGKMFEGIVIHMNIDNKIKYYKIHRGHLGLGNFINISKSNILNIENNIYNSEVTNI